MFPVVFLEADVMPAQIDPARFEALQVELLHLVGRGLEDHLKLVVLVQPIRILAEAPVGGPPRRLHVCDVPMAGAQHPQERLGVHRPGAQFDVERLLKEATASRPEFRELEYELL